MRWFTLISIALGLVALVPAGGQAQTLHERIDQAMAAKAGGKAAGPAGDAEFLRRAWLDFAGVIPTVEEAARFFADKDPSKRARAIDRLLAGAEYSRRMSQAVTVWLLERRDGQVVPDESWNQFLQESFAANKPWDQLVREVIAADGRDPKTRAAMRFFVDGGRHDLDVMTQDVARLLLGMNLHCAQCHDHPNVPDFKQEHYFGIYSYLKQSKVQNDKSGKAFFIERPAGEKSTFKSVFTQKTSNVGPKLPFGDEVVIPVPEKGQEFIEPAKDGLPGVPKFRSRQVLAEKLTAPANERFTRTSVNYFWFLLMGRGLVHPLDLMHSKNPPSHPELFDALSAEFVKNRFDVKYLLREIALSQTYQRSSVLPEGLAARDAIPEKYLVANAKPLSAEQMAWSAMRATGNLERILAKPVPKASKFTYKDYVNGRLPPPDNIGDVMSLFRATFGNPPGESEVEFSPSAGQSLFLMNEKLILDWLKPANGNLTARVLMLKDSSRITEELYLGILTRLPDQEEKATFTEYLAKHSQRRDAAVSELGWALLTSAEFRLNH